LVFVHCDFIRGGIFDSFQLVYVCDVSEYSHLLSGEVNSLPVNLRKTLKTGVYEIGTVLIAYHEMKKKNKKEFMK
jgi:hypothetical protein